MRKFNSIPKHNFCVIFKGSQGLDKTYNGFALSGSGDLITVVFNRKKSITPIMALWVNGTVKIFKPLY